MLSLTVFLPCSVLNDFVLFCTVFVCQIYEGLRIIEKYTGGKQVGHENQIGFFFFFGNTIATLLFIVSVTFFFFLRM